MWKCVAFKVFLRGAHVGWSRVSGYPGPTIDFRNTQGIWIKYLPCGTADQTHLFSLSFSLSSPNVLQRFMIDISYRHLSF